MLQHIALEIKETDLQQFYADILGCEAMYNFLLQKELAFELFKVSENIDVHRVKLDDLELELFVHDGKNYACLQHTCLVMPNAKEIFEKAEAAGYSTQILKKGDHETYFVRDKNHNLFELKK